MADHLLKYLAICQYILNFELRNSLKQCHILRLHYTILIEHSKYFQLIFLWERGPIRLHNSQF